MVENLSRSANYFITNVIKEKKITRKKKMNNKNRKIPNISNLHAEKLVKEQARNEIFTIVLNKCIDQIVETNSRTEHTFIYFEVPVVLVSVINFIIKRFCQFTVIFGIHIFFKFHICNLLRG